MHLPRDALLVRGKADEPMSMERPALHFTPKKGWINDPNGLIWDGKRYHLFAQHNPDDVVWGPMHWLHAVSDDLLHWKELGIALYPDELGTMFSGSAAMLPDGRMALMYTTHGDQQRQCVAFSGDGLHFEKYPGNPVIDNPGLRDFRDPKLFWNEKRGCWGVAVAASDRIAFYRSDDLTHWQKTGEFADTRLGELFECPDLFFLRTPEGEEIAVLTASMICLHGEKGCRMQYFLGEFDGETFVERVPAQEALRMDVGYDSYAGVTFHGTAETIWMNWMSATSCPLPLKGYCGCMSLPRKLGLRRVNGTIRLTQQCVLPDAPYRAAARDERLPDGAFSLLLRGEGPFELALCDESGEAALRAGVDAEGMIYTAREKSGRFAPESAYNDDARRITRVPRQTRGPLEMQVVCDGYCVEIFAEDGLYAHGLLAFPEGGFRRARCTGTAEQGIQML